MKYYVCGKASGYFLGEYLEWDLHCGPYKTLKIAENIKKIMLSRNNEICKELYVQKEEDSSQEK